MTSIGTSSIRILHLSASEMTLTDISSFWGTSLKRLEPDTLDRLSLADQTLKFLVNIGLPVNAGERLGRALEVNFYFDCNKIAQVTFAGATYGAIGDDGGSTFALSGEADTLYSIDFPNSSICLVNSSIWQFLQCLQTFAAYQHASRNVTDQRALVQSMFAEFMAIDHCCVNKPDTWWSMIINEPI